MTRELVDNKTSRTQPRREPSGRQVRDRRRAEAHRRQRRVRRVGYAAVGLIAALLVTLAIVLPSSGTPAGSHGATAGAGPAVGTTAPSFSLSDVMSNTQVSLQSLSGHKTLLFFSEGVGCQACMVQAVDLQNTKALSDADIQLVSVTTDQPGQLAQAGRQYGINKPLLADPTTAMSAAYGMLGSGGMQHPTQDGHAFVLLDAIGKVVWHRAYQTMYVPTNQLLSDMGVKA